MATLSSPLLLLFLFLLAHVNAHLHLLSAHEIHCISASSETHHSALARWMACLPPSFPHHHQSPVAAPASLNPPLADAPALHSNSLLPTVDPAPERLAAGNTSTDNCTAIATNEHVATEQERHFFSDKDTRGDCDVDATDDGTFAEESAHLQIEDDDTDTNCKRTGIDCEEKGDVYRDHDDALRTVLKLNVGLALCAGLISMLRCRRNKKKNGARLQKHSSNIIKDAARSSGTDILTGGKIMQVKTRAEDLQPRTLGTYLGTAIGAVFAEVVLNTSRSSKPCVSADDLSTILETAIRESLRPIAGIESMALLENFMASFRSAYYTISKVHQACSKEVEAPCQGNQETAYVSLSSESGMSVNHTEPCRSNSAKNDSLSVQLSHQLDREGGTDDLDDSLYNLDKNNYGSKMSCDECGTSGSDADVQNTNPPDFSRHKRGHETKFCSPMDVLAWADTMDVLAECQHVHLSGKNKELRERGECSPLEVSARPQDYIPQVYGSSKATLRNRMTMESMMVQDQGSPTIRSSGGTFSAHAPRHVHQAGGSQDIQLIQEGDMHASQNLNSCVDESEQRGRKFVSSYHSESTPGNTASAGPDVQCDDEDGSITQEHSEIVELTGGMLDSAVMTGPTHGATQFAWQKAFLHVFEKSVHAQEQHNYIKSVELAHLLGRLSLKEEQLQLASVSNELMKENIELSRSKAGFKESKVIEERLNAAHVHFSRTCADELVAGLFVMLVSLSYGVRRYSFARLFDLVSTCQPSFKEPRQSSWLHIDWFYNSLNSLAGQLQAFTCQVTVAGRILVGLAIVAIVASSLLRQSVTSCSQSMPATIIIIVLGGVCGFAGKMSVDSLGGNGIRWLIVWEMFCALHALATCFTPFVFKIINGSPSSKKATFQIPFWFRRFAFHFILVLVLPVMAGQLPFVSMSTVMKDASSMFADIAAQTVIFLREYMAQLV